MGWQSYVLYYNTEEQKQKIIDTIKSHNEYKCQCDKPPIFNCEICGEYNECNCDCYDCDCYDDIGEELEMVSWIKMKKPYKRGIGKNCEYAILCGNGGGRHSTFNYFYKNGIRAEEYTSAFLNRINKKEQGEVVINTEPLANIDSSK